jgi:LysM repeat protein
MRLKAITAVLVMAAFVTAASGSTASAETLEQNQKPQTSKTTNVVVQPGDYLAKIAEEHQTTYTRLFDANTSIADPDIIHPGENVRIPTADEQLAKRPIPSNAPAVAPAPVQAPAPAPAAKAAVQPKQAAPVRSTPKAVAPVSSASAGVWDRLAMCESGGNWSINTGNGYYGGLQFSLSSWRAVGGSGYPHQASKAEQIARAEILKARQGWGAWPACTIKLGIR